ncbi:hypothetical protein JTE90_019309 [Oedothorax gibbosus]|uniref:Uncharacterized protein n=1 Tax=Oedothorax gibbosus TaxID=931172 RepID=A0AAV6TMT4_9ARAC|nr:hypothetical protein JTE90_019309 [Oedothorax gibbosus]
MSRKPSSKQTIAIFANKYLRKRTIRSDVDILRRCCINFRQEFLDVTGVDPFQYITIPCACMAVFRTNHLLPDSIAVVPVQGYIRNINTSRASIEWLKYLEKTEDCYIHQYANGQGEVKVEGRFVDGATARKPRPSNSSWVASIMAVKPVIIQIQSTPFIINR